MEEIGYKHWGLIVVDTGTTSEESYEESYVVNPPMLTTVALDKEASLIFQLLTCPARLTIHVETTAASAENRSAALLKIFTGSSAAQFSEVQHGGWEKNFDGMYAIFTARIDGVQEYIKFLSTEDPALIVNRITFEA